jgi:hypothetical protein
MMIDHHDIGAPRHIARLVNMTIIKHGTVAAQTVVGGRRHPGANTGIVRQATDLAEVTACGVLRPLLDQCQLLLHDRITQLRLSL